MCFAKFTRTAKVFFAKLPMRRKGAHSSSLFILKFIRRSFNCVLNSTESFRHDTVAPVKYEIAFLDRSQAFIRDY